MKAKVSSDNMELIINMTGELAQLMCKLDKDLQQDNQRILYLQCKKALHGHIEAASLFCDNLNESIQQKMKFVQNMYDPCVYNKQTEDRKVTIIIHVDDLKISAGSKKQLEEVIENL